LNLRISSGGVKRRGNGAGKGEKKGKARRNAIRARFEAKPEGNKQEEVVYSLETRAHGSQKHLSEHTSH